ncbi:hypothetical protein [Geodermatophilus sp. URMC 62]|uniref:hypothetical protein n=1 Tax=Geodermatophilus sp. URMC 62 TaxID=3423414 RepID=UPI00406C2971
MTNSESVNGPSQEPPEWLLDFLRQVEGKGAPDDLRLKARIARESLETGELPVLADLGSPGATTQVRLGACGERVYEVSVVDLLPATDDAQHALEAIKGKVPPQVFAFLWRRAEAAGDALLIELIIEVISRGQGPIFGL